MEIKEQVMGSQPKPIVEFDIKSCPRAPKMKPWMVSPDGSDRTFCSSKTPADQVPSEDDVQEALRVILYDLPTEHSKTIKSGNTLDQWVERVGRAAWTFFYTLNVAQMWPNMDSVVFPPHKRAALLRALVVLDLWIFRPRG